jgi:DNA-binding CsgD family transcriptional regulator
VQAGARRRGAAGGGGFRLADHLARDRLPELVDAWSGEFSMYLPVAAQWLAFSLVELGDLDAASRAVDYPDAEERWGHTNMYGPLKAAEGRIARARGDHARALEAFLAAGGSVLGGTVPNPAILSWRSDAALAAAAAGESEQAARLAEEELELARRFGAPRAAGVALRAAGLVKGGERGVGLLEEAASTLRRSPSRLELARALIDLGAAIRRQGSPASAREPLREGLEMAQRFGAVALERRASEELLASGARPRRRELTGVDSLTPSELRVARMAAEGMTNRQIAQELFVTVKSVQWHLRNAYRKLDLTGREQLPEKLASDHG